VNVRGIQQMLKNLGYDITVDGKFGPQTAAALDNVAASGKGKLTAGEQSLINGTDGAKANPIHTALGVDDWNQRFGQGAAKVFPAPTKANINQLANGTPNAQIPPQQSVNLNPLQQALSSATGKPIPSSLANFGTMIDPSTAADYATEQYGPQVSMAQFLVGRDPLQAKQNQKSIADWYSQVMDALGTATGRDQAASTAGVSSISNAAQAIAASLGGSANAGTPEVAAAGQNGVNTLAAMGTAQSQFNNDMAPILRAGQATSAQNQMNMDAVQEQQDRAQLAALQSQEGAAQATAGNQITQENNALAQSRNAAATGILQYNNGLGQQTLQNLLGIDSLQGQLSLDGVKTNYDNALTAQALARAGSLMGGKNSFGSTSSATLAKLAGAVLGAGSVNGIVDANGKPLSGMTRAQAIARATANAGVLFPGGGVPSGWINTIVSNAGYTPGAP
jgi:hypothetical protein